MKIFFLFCLVAVSSIACAQTMALYQAGDLHGKYVLSRYYSEGGGNNVSEVIIGEALAVLPGDGFCEVTMSNAFVFRTIVSNVQQTQPHNGIKQDKTFVNVLKIKISNTEKVFFHDAALQLSQIKPEEVRVINAQQYQGDAAVRELGKMGLAVPDDMDFDTLTNHTHKGVTHQ